MSGRAGWLGAGGGLGLGLGARAKQRAAPGAFVPEVGSARVELARDAGPAAGAAQPVGDVDIPRPRSQLGLERIDAPAAARPRVQETVAVDRVLGARLRP